MGISLKDLESVWHTVESAPNGVEKAVGAGETTAFRVIKGGLEYAHVPLDEISAANIDEIAGAMSHNAIIPASIGALVADLWLTLLNRKWINATDRLPGPFRTIARNLVTFVLPLHGAVTTYIQKLYDLQHTLYEDGRKVWAFHYTSEQALINGATAKPSAPVHAPPHATQNPVTPAQIQHLQSEINALSHALGIQQHRGTIPEQVWQQIHAAQTDIHKLQHSVSDLYEQVNAAKSDAASAQSQVSDLSHALHGVATVATNWQDISEALQNHVTRLTQQLNSTNATVHHQGSELQALAPLAVLLSAGALGLRTLRQLEDTPCMCPRFLNIPNEVGTALAMVEFIENG